MGMESPGRGRALGNLLGGEVLNLTGLSWHPPFSELTEWLFKADGFPAWKLPSPRRERVWFVMGSRVLRSGMLRSGVLRSGVLRSEAATDHHAPLFPSTRGRGLTVPPGRGLRAGVLPPHPGVGAVPRVQRGTRVGLCALGLGRSPRSPSARPWAGPDPRPAGSSALGEQSVGGGHRSAVGTPGDGLSQGERGGGCGRTAEAPAQRCVGGGGGDRGTSDPRLTQA